MDERLANLLLMLLEREAQIQKLDKELDDAIRETVRSKAKLTSLESRAEAASNLAEAEVALKTLTRSVKGLAKRPEAIHMAALMKTSAEELKKENYGGSLYLTNQIKSKLLDLQDQIENEQGQRSGASATGNSSSSSEFDAKVARLQEMLAEKDAQVQKLQRRLDDTIQEAVRTKAKLRSQDSKADAASDYAEAETELMSFTELVRAGQGVAEVTQAAKLMKMGAAELKKENYSGALYLTNQVKSLLRGVQEQAQGRDKMTPVAGEVPFALPLAVNIAASGKARERPAADSAVAWSVKRGTTPVALSYKGTWIRLKGVGDRWGWIYYDLIASP